jgi:arylsulfatase A-like enzyme
MKIRILLALVLLAAVAALWFVLSGYNGSKRLPNVLIVTCDSLRTDRLHLYGNSRPTSPFLDAFARESVVFDRCYANSSFTPPSHGSILTGQYVKTHGVLWWNDVLSSATPTLAERFGTPKDGKVARGLGYRTGAFVNLDNLTSLGLTRGFEHVRSETWLPGDDLNRDFLAWVDDRADARPFCAWLHYWDPHRPYAFRSFRFLNPGKNEGDLAKMAPAERAATEKLIRTSLRPDLIFNETQFGKGDLGVGRDESHYNRKRATRDQPLFVPISNVKRPFTAEDDRFLVDRYDGGVAYLDEQLKVMVEGLRRRGELDHTILVITSDHGESFAERDDEYFTHDPHLYDEVTHVPLIIRFPGGEHGGTRLSALAESIDLLPTIHDAIGILTNTIRRELPGESLLPAIAGAARAKTFVFSQTQGKQPGPAVPGKPARFVVTDRKYSVRTLSHRLIAAPAEKDGWHFEFYDLERDPGARTNLHQSPPGDEEKRMFAALQEWMKNTLSASDAERQMSDAELKTLMEGNYIGKGAQFGKDSAR